MGRRLAAALNPLANPCSRNQSLLISIPRQRVLTVTRRTTAILLLMATMIAIATGITAAIMVVVAVHPPFLVRPCPIPVRRLLPTTITTTTVLPRVILPTPKTLKTSPRKQTRTRQLISPTALTRMVVCLLNVKRRTLLPRILRK